MTEEVRVEAARWLSAGTFQDRVCVVTGGATALGLEVSRGLASLGADVTILSRDREPSWCASTAAVGARSSPS